MNKENARSKKIIWIVVVCAVLVAIPTAVTYLQKRGAAPSPEKSPLQAPSETPEQKPAQRAEKYPKEPSGMPAAGKPAPQPPLASETLPGKSFTPAQAPAVVDYGKIKEDPKLKALMEKRKEKYGFEKGVDIIIKPEESLKVGDETIPMKEILESIRLESGELIETDITESKKPPRGETSIEAEMGAIKRRLKEIERLLERSDKKQDIKTDTDTDKALVREYARLKRIESVYKAYQETIREIERKQELLSNLPSLKKKPSKENEAPLKMEPEPPQGLKQEDLAQKPNIEEKMTQGRAKKSASLVETTPSDSDKEAGVIKPSKEKTIEKPIFADKSRIEKRVRQTPSKKIIPGKTSPVERKIKKEPKRDQKPYSRLPQLPRSKEAPQVQPPAETSLKDKKPQPSEQK
ncbi:MAG: hypothetical protein JRJ04_06020, partial [Deltaproteobacteria bacterium]|nr:hypothetical protein [Deltaproteobacteria bacterium]